jgi:hypothetical protein
MLQNSPDLDISQTTRLQALISFAYSQEKGVYVSVYYHSTSSYPFPGRTEEVNGRGMDGTA